MRILRLYGLPIVLVIWAILRLLHTNPTPVMLLLAAVAGVCQVNALLAHYRNRRRHHDR